MTYVPFVIPIISILFLWQIRGYIITIKQGDERKKIAIWLGAFFFILSVLCFFIGRTHHKAWNLQGLVFLIALFAITESGRFRYNKKNSEGDKS